MSSGTTIEQRRRRVLVIVAAATLLGGGVIVETSSMPHAPHAMNATAAAIAAADDDGVSTGDRPVVVVVPSVEETLSSQCGEIDAEGRQTCVTLSIGQPASTPQRVRVLNTPGGSPTVDPTHVPEGPGRGVVAVPDAPVPVRVVPADPP